MVPKSQFPKASGKYNHSNDACKLCWTKHLTVAAMEMADLNNIPCLCCGCQIDYEKDFKRLAEKPQIEQ